MRWRGKKVLCICQKGNSRSVHLAYMLKRERKSDAIAVGIETAKPDTFDMLCRWADRIVLTDKSLDRPALDPYRDKLLHFDVGRDRWTPKFSQELLDKYRKYMKELDEGSERSNPSA